MSTMRYLNNVSEQAPWQAGLCDFGNIDDTHHASGMELGRQRSQVISGTKFLIHRVDVILPVAVVRRAVNRETFDLMSDGRNPYRVEAETLNVVQSVDETVPGAATVVGYACIT